MSQSKQLAARLREVFLDGQWIANTNFRQILENVSRKHAVEKIEHVNTIAALVFHINYYLNGVLQVLEGGDLEISDKFSFDLPRFQTEADWQDLKERLFANAATFAREVEEMSDEELSSTFVKEQYGSYQRNIEAIIEHSYYHLGQISLIKKQLGVK